MTRILETINNRAILYLDIQQDLRELEAIHLKNWVLFVIEDDSNNPVLQKFAELCIDKDLLYLCAAGKACSQVDDLFDQCMVMRELDKGKLPSWYLSPDDVLMTTWHHNFDEGFWFVTRVANYNDLPIELVVVANLTNRDYLPIIQNLVRKISNGRLPPD